MHPIDSGTTPSGEGGSSRSSATTTTRIRRADQLALPATDPRRTDFGPNQFLTDKVLRKLNDPRLRLFGVRTSPSPG